MTVYIALHLSANLDEIHDSDVLVLLEEVLLWSRGLDVFDVLESGFGYSLVVLESVLGQRDLDFEESQAAHVVIQISAQLHRQILYLQVAQ